MFEDALIGTGLENIPEGHNQYVGGGGEVNSEKLKE